MATKTTKPDIIHKLKISKEDFNNSAEWFAKEVEGMSGNDTRRKILKLQSRRTSYITAGKMFLFTYDAKHKDTLPKWDIFPLVFPLSKTKDGFIGLNLHYINPSVRIRVIQELLKFANNQHMSATTRIVAQWNVIKTVSQSKNLGIETCIKRYLTNQMRSSFIEIPPTSWMKVATLQLEKFVYKV